MKKLILIIGFVTGVSLTLVQAQKVQISSNPTKAYVIVNGTSSVSTTTTRENFIGDGGMLVYKENHLPVFLEPDNENQSIEIDLVPVTDLIGDQETAKIEFSKLVLSIPALREIGATGMTDQKTVFNGYVERSLESNLDIWKEMVEKELGEQNVNMHIEEADLFGGQGRKESAEYLLGAEIKGMWISTTKRKCYTYVELEWSLFDKRKRSVVLKTTTYGYGHGPEGKRDDLDASFRSAAKHLTRDEEFVGVIMGSGSGNVSVENDGPAPISIPLIEELTVDMGSNLIKRCVASTVTVVTSNGHGSGVIISDDGKILTNHHVIEKSNVVDIVLSSGLQLEAEVLRSDEHFDVAILQIKSGKGYMALPVAIDTENPTFEVGDEVMAIGTPQDVALGQTVSRGVVSGKRKTDDDRYFIQTDVSINPGNSGGPLIDSEGRVIGLITIKRFDSEGIGFAIPVQQAIETLDLVFD